MRDAIIKKKIRVLILIRRPCRFSLCILVNLAILIAGVSYIIPFANVHTYPVSISMIIISHLV